MNQIKVLGSPCYASTLQSHRTKLSCKARKSIFLGYVIAFKGCVLLELNSQEEFISKNTTFHEHILSYITQNSYVTRDW